jgi:hypothetical protein
MILTEKVTIKTHTRLKKYYENLGYDMTGEYADIRVEDLTKSSHIVIDVKCDVCGKEKKIKYEVYNKNYKKCNFYSCSHKCANEKREITCLEKYNHINVFQNEEIKDKCKQTFLEKFGVTNPNKNRTIREKIEQTNIERYGNKTPLLNEDVKTKSKKTSQEKYGSNNYMTSDIGFSLYKEKLKNKYGYETSFNSKEVLDKGKKLTKEKYGEENYFKTEIFKINRDEKLLNQYNFLNIKKVKNGIYYIYCDKCKQIFEIYNNLLCQRLKAGHELCTICSPIGKSISNDIKFIIDFIKLNYNGKIIINDRKILSGLELDIYLPDLKIAFEYNGLYWHSEKFKSNNYHMNKTDMCEVKGISLIHIYEDEWNDKKDIIKSNILNSLNKISVKIDSRKCVVKEVNSKNSKDFLDTNHIQGGIDSDIKLGLFHHDELVFLMIFNSTQLVTSDFELLRFCCKLNTMVIGGAIKLIKYFVDNYKPKAILTFADRSWLNSNLYLNLGFKIICKTKPNYDYVINGERINKKVFEKDVLIKENIDVNKIVYKSMKERCYFKIFDSGSIKFVYTND